MLSGYIIEKYNNMVNAYTCNRLVEEAKNINIDLKIIGVYDTFVGKNGILNAGTALEKRDFVINRYKWGELKDSINQLADRSYNPLEAYNTYVNKYMQVKNLSSDAFLIPNYILSTSAISFGMLKETIGVPCVVKGLESSMGQEVLLIEKEEDLIAIRKNYSADKEWLFEEFIETSFGRDMRFYSIRGEVVACMQRKSQGDFRANVALGATVEAYEITEDIKQAAKDIYEQTKLDFLGIDLLFGKDKPYFCEINVMPGLEGIEKASGINVARRIMETIKGDFQKYE